MAQYDILDEKACPHCGSVHIYLLIQEDPQTGDLIYLCPDTAMTLGTTKKENVKKAPPPSERIKKGPRY